MSASISDRTLKMCALFKAGVPVKQIAADFGVLNPAVFKALRRGGALPPYCPRKKNGPGRPVGGGTRGWTDNRLAKSAAAIASREAREPARPGLTPIDRDPCFYCGTRGDVGCKHRKAA